MRKLMIGLSILLAVATFVPGVMAQETRPETQPPAAEKAKTEKLKGSEQMRVYGTVVAYKVGKTISVKGRKGQEWSFDIAPGPKIKGDVKEGEKVRVGYKKEGDNMVASSISVATPRKAKPLTKEGETK